MKITVTGINTDEAVLVRGTSALGWRGKFGCPLVTGEAVFIPSRGFERNLQAGSTLVVDTSFESVSDMVILEAGASIDSMQPLPDAGDYLVCGAVVFVAPQGLVRVSVRGLIFTIAREELGALKPTVGQCLRFAVHGLTLWDTSA